MSFTELINKRKLTLVIIGVMIATIMGGKDSNFWGMTEKSGKQILEEIDKGKLISKEVRLSEQQREKIKELINKNPEKYSPQQKALASEKTGKEILDEIDAEKVNVDTVYLNYEQLQAITQLIIKNPENYTRHQKYLLRVKNGEEILREVGGGIRDPNYIKLTPEQLKEIKVLINRNPDDYNSAQKMLLNK